MRFYFCVTLLRPVIFAHSELDCLFISSKFSEKVLDCPLLLIIYFIIPFERASDGMSDFSPQKPISISRLYLLR